MTTKPKAATKAKSKPAAKPKAQRGRPPMGEVAAEARWNAWATLEEDRLLKSLADRFTNGNKSLALRKAVQIFASINPEPLKTKS